MLLEPKMGPAQWGMSIGVIVVGALFFWLVTRAGARIIGALAKMLSEKGSGRGLISVCTAGGMGVSAIIEAA